MEISGILRSDISLVVSAAAMDWFAGEPRPGLHPVVWMGRLTKLAERCVTSRKPLVQLGAGALIALLVPGLFAGGAALLLRKVAPWPLLGFVLGVWLLKSTFALRALGAAGREVRKALDRGDLDGARRNLGSLCSRDASALSEQDLVAGTVESLAENTSDSVIAPLFYFALFGIPGAVFYRAVNTLDSMIGYHGRYEYLGKAAARLDDLLNLIPARLTAALLLLGGIATRQDARRGWSILRRDGGKTESPNAGRPMAAMAGLLHVQLEKKGHYRLGDPLAPLGAENIETAWRIVLVAAVFAFAATATTLALRGSHGS